MTWPQRNAAAAWCTVLNLRHVVGDASPRKIQIPGTALLSGDVSLNIFVRAGDTIIVSATGTSASSSKLKSIRLVVDVNSLEFEGKPVTWEELAALLEKLPDHPNTVLEISAKSDQLTVGRFFEAENRASELVRKYGFKYLSEAGIHTPDAAPRAR